MHDANRGDLPTVLNDKGTPLVESHLRETIQDFVDNTRFIFIVLHVLEHRLQEKGETHKIGR